MAMFLSNKFTYPQRLFMWLLGYSLLLVGCLVFFQYHREKEFKEERINSRLQTFNSYLLAELERGRSVSEMNIEEFRPFDNIRISVIAENGNIIYDNTLDSTDSAN